MVGDQQPSNNAINDFLYYILRDRYFSDNVNAPCKNTVR